MTPRPERAAELRCFLFGAQLARQPLYRPFSIPNPPGRMLFGLGAVLQHSQTPSLRVTGFEDDDEDENENEAPCER
jgi:hypothetical protein